MVILRVGTITDYLVLKLHESAYPPTIRASIVASRLRGRSVRLRAQPAADRRGAFEGGTAAHEVRLRGRPREAPSRLGGTAGSRRSKTRCSPGSSRRRCCSMRTCKSRRHASSRRRATSRSPGGAVWPSVGVLAKGGGKSGGSGRPWTASGCNASLELDVWGRLRYGRAAAEAQSAAAEAGLRVRAPASLAATVAKSWSVATESRAPARDRAGGAALVRGIAARRAGAVPRRQRQRAGGAKAHANVGAYGIAVREIEFGARAGAARAGAPARPLSGGGDRRRDQSAPMPPPVRVGMPSQLLERRPDVCRRSGASPRRSTAWAKRAPRSFRASA